MSYACALSISDHETLFINGCHGAVFNHVSQDFEEMSRTDICGDTAGKRNGI